MGFDMTTGPLLTYAKTLFFVAYYCAITLCLCFCISYVNWCTHVVLTLTVLVTTIDAQWEGMGDVGRRGTSRHYFRHARPQGF